MPSLQEMQTRTLDWRNKRRWVGDIPKYADDILSVRLRRRLQSSKRKVCWSDDLSWLPDQSILTDLMLAFHDYYSHVKAFHGCRPASVRSYYEHGIRGHNELELLKCFRTIFSDVDEKFLTRASQAMTRDHLERGRSYFLCDDGELVETCGHYLIQGSEFVMALAASLCHQRFSSEDFRMRLRHIGIPTVFEVDVPLSHIPSQFIELFCKSIVAEWGRCATRSRSGGADAMCLILSRDLPRECIVRHWHPTLIPDPHVPYGKYAVEAVRCDDPQCEFAA